MFQMSDLIAQRMQFLQLVDQMILLFEVLLLANVYLTLI